MSEYDNEQDQRNFDFGLDDGYNGNNPRFNSDAYLAGFKAGQAQWDDEVENDRLREQYEDYYYSSDVDMGMYDDDPNPYHGDYSEM
jgi:hypothetical protein